MFDCLFQQECSFRFPSTITRRIMNYIFEYTYCGIKIALANNKLSVSHKCQPTDVTFLHLTARTTPQNYNNLLYLSDFENFHTLYFKYVRQVGRSCYIYCSARREYILRAFVLFITNFTYLFINKPTQEKEQQFKQRSLLKFVNHLSGI